MRLLLLLCLSALAAAQPREATCTIVDTGGDDAYVGTCQTGTTLVRLVATTANTGAATISIDGGTTPTAIKHGGTADPSDGAIPGSGKVVLLWFDGTYWQIQSSGATGTSGGASSVTGLYSGTLNFGSIPDGGWSQLTFTATGLSAGAALAVSPPPTLESGLLVSAIASAADTVAIRLVNLSGAAVDPGSATFAVRDMTNLGYLSGSGVIDFGPITDGTCVASTLTVAGASSGDNVAPGWPSTLEAGLAGSMFVSATNTITVRLCNWSGATVDPASQTFKAAVTK